MIRRPQRSTQSRSSAASDVYKRQGYAEKNIEVLNWFETYVKSVKPEAYLVAEVWEGQGVLQEYYKSGIDSLFNFPASQQDGAIIKTAKARVTPQQFFSWMVKQQTADRLANPDYIDAPFISNHDTLSLIHISEPTRLGMISYAVFCLKKKKNVCRILLEKKKTYKKKKIQQTCTIRT